MLSCSWSLPTLMVGPTSMFMLAGKVQQQARVLPISASAVSVTMILFISCTLRIRVVVRVSALA